MAGALVGEVGVSLFVAGTVFADVHIMLACHFSWQAQYLVKLQNTRVRSESVLVCVSASSCGTHVTIGHSTSMKRVDTDIVGNMKLHVKWRL